MRVREIKRCPHFKLIETYKQRRKIAINKNDTAVEREKAGKMFELNEKYKDFPERVSEYEIDGKKYIVHSRFVGEKNIDEVIGRLAFERAMKETLA